MRLTDLDFNIQNFAYITEYLEEYDMPSNDCLILFYFDRFTSKFIVYELYDRYYNQVIPEIKEILVNDFSDGSFLYSYDIKTGKYARYRILIEDKEWSPDVS